MDAASSRRRSRSARRSSALSVASDARVVDPVDGQEVDGEVLVEEVVETPAAERERPWAIVATAHNNIAGINVQSQLQEIVTDLHLPIDRGGSV